MAVIAARGPAALTHRAAAEGAGVPLARVSYHFPTVDDLLAAAASRYLAEFDARLRAAAVEAASGRRSMVEAGTDFLEELIGSDAPAFLAMVEVRIALARRGRTIASDGTLGVVQAFGADATSAASIVSSLFGFAVLAATEPDPIPRRAIRAHVATVLGTAS